MFPSVAFLLVLGLSQEGPASPLDEAGRVALSHTADLIGVQFSPDARFVAAQTLSQTLVWETLTGKPLGSLPSRFAEFTEDSSFVVAHNLAGTDGQRVEAGELPLVFEVRRLPAFERIQGIALEPDEVPFLRGVKALGNRRVAVGEKGAMVLINLESGAKELAVPAEGRGPRDTVLAGERWIVGRGKGVQVWDLKSGAEAWRFGLAENLDSLWMLGPRYLAAAVWNAQRIGTAESISGTKLEVWDLLERRRIDLPGTPCSAVLAADGNSLVVGTLDGLLEVYATRSWERRRSWKVAKGAVSVHQVSSDGRRALATAARLRVWDLETGLKNDSPGLGFRGARGDQAILMGEKEVALYDVKEFKIVSRAGFENLWGAAFLGDRPLAVRKEGPRIEVLDVRGRVTR